MGFAALLPVRRLPPPGPLLSETLRSARFRSVFDFDLSPDELAAIDALDTGQRGGPEPTDINVATYGMPIPEA